MTDLRETLGIALGLAPIALWLLLSIVFKVQWHLRAEPAVRRRRD